MPKISKHKQASSAKKQIARGRMYVVATFNNTLVTITDDQGNVMASGTTGMAGFSGSRKSTPYAATMAIERVLNLGRERGLKQVGVYIKGPGAGRDAVLRVLRNSGLKIALLADVTPMPHNGTRPKKQRRV